MMPGRRAAGALATLFLLTATLCGCVVPPARDSVTRLDALGEGEVLIVGKVELVPPLRREEQKIQALNSGSMINRMFLLADEKARVLEGEPKLADYRGRIEAALGETFFVRSPARSFNLIGGIVFLTDTEKAYFPAGMKISVLPGDRAVYIGTIRYSRDEFFNVTNVAVVDDYAHASAQFKAKFGAQSSLRRALARR